MACDPNELLDASKCIFACTSEGQRSAIKIYLLANLAGVSADPNTLLDNAKCIESCLTLGQMKAVEVWLLCQIAGV
jgi:hypothetical protein